MTVDPGQPTSDPVARAESVDPIDSAGPGGDGPGDGGPVDGGPVDGGPVDGTQVGVPPVDAGEVLADHTGGAESPELTEPVRRHWYDRIGIISGIVLFLLALAGLIFLAAIGFSPALYLLVLVAVGVFLVIQGTRLHGPRRSSS
jgi:hypothetical protein